jgi:hypothetical protein
MPDISRRRFLRNASVGAAAVGTVAVVGPSALGAATASAAPLSAKGLLHDQGAAAGSRPSGKQVMAHVVDDSSGTVSLYVGTKKVTFKDHALTEALLKASR